MIGLEAGKKFLRLVNAIPYTGEHPIGCFLVAPPGSGKSYLLTKSISKSFIIVSDITGFGLEKLILEMTERKSGYVIVPDILRASSRKNSFEQLTSLLNIILEEGLRVIKRYNLDIELREPLRFGFITAVTDSEYEKMVSKFWSTGLLSRIIIFSFHYQPSDAERIQKVVALGDDDRMIYRLNGLKETNIDIPSQLAKKISDLAKRLGKDRYAFRNIKLLRKLVKANALLENRTRVSMKDVKEIYCLFPFISHGDALKISPASDLHYIIMRYLARKTVMPDKIKVRGYTQEEIENTITDLVARGFITSNKKGLTLKI